MTEAPSTAGAPAVGTGQLPAELQTDWQLEPSSDGSLRLSRTKQGRARLRSDGIGEVLFGGILWACAIGACFAYFRVPDPAAQPIIATIGCVLALIAAAVLPRTLRLLFGQEEWILGDDRFEVHAELFKRRSIARFTGAELRLIRSASRHTSYWSLHVLQRGAGAPLLRRTLLQQQVHSISLEALSVMGDLLAGVTGWPFLIDGALQPRARLAAIADAARGAPAHASVSPARPGLPPSSAPSPPPASRPPSRR